MVSFICDNPVTLKGPQRRDPKIVIFRPVKQKKSEKKSSYDFYFVMATRHDPLYLRKKLERSYLRGYLTSLVARPSCVRRSGRKRRGRRRSECNTPQGHSKESQTGRLINSPAAGSCDRAIPICP